MTLKQALPTLYLPSYSIMCNDYEPMRLQTDIDCAIPSPTLLSPPPKEQPRPRASVTGPRWTSTVEKEQTCRSD